MTSTSTLNSRRRPRFNDYLALALVKLARLKRSSFAQEEEEYAEFYEQFFDEKDLDLYDKDRRMVVRRETLLATLAEYVTENARILDVGCGLGDVLVGLPEQYQLSGMEYSHKCVEVSKRRLGTRADIRQGSIYEIPFEDGSFDVCLCLEVLEHIEDDTLGVREMARVLKPGGILIAAVPYTYYWPQYQSLMGHFRHYTRKSFSALMQKGGLNAEVYLPNYPRWHQTYTRRYALVRAQAMVFGRFFGTKTLHDFKWPWQPQPALAQLEKSTEGLRQRDKKLDYSRQSTSTFLIARKANAD